MGDWTFATGDATTRKHWARDFWIEAKTESYFYGNGFVGSSPYNDIIMEYPDLEKDQGDTVTFAELRELSGSGVAADNTMEGSEDDTMALYDDAVTLAQIRNAVRTNGRYSDQLPSDKALRKWMKELLDRWMAATLDQDFFTKLAASGTKALYGGDATGTGDIEAGDYMTLQLIAKAKAYARKATPMIVGPTIGGKQTAGVAVIATDQEFDLQEYDASWAQAQREAMKPGYDNPIFTGASGIYKKVVIHEHPRIALATNWGTGAINGATGLFLGVGAGVIAYAKRKIWEEKTFDYGNKVGFCVGAIYGFTKTVFNAADKAVVLLRTYRTSN